VTRSPTLPRLPRAIISLLLLLAAACDTNPFDAAQQPRVTIAPGPGASPGIAWEPSGAQLVRVYRGAVAGDGYGDDLMWSVAAATRNGITSPVQYGVVPSGGVTDVAPKLLVAGETYTAQVTRLDPKGSGDGFTNTGNRYVGSATFTATTTGPGGP